MPRAKPDLAALAATMAAAHPAWQHDKQPEVLDIINPAAEADNVVAIKAKRRNRRGWKYDGDSKPAPPPKDVFLAYPSEVSVVDVRVFTEPWTRDQWLRQLFQLYYEFDKPKDRLEVLKIFGEAEGFFKKAKDDDAPLGGLAALLLVAIKDGRLSAAVATPKVQKLLEAGRSAALQSAWAEGEYHEEVRDEPGVEG